jgi:acylphosphatase
LSGQELEEFFGIRYSQNRAFKPEENTMSRPVRAHVLISGRVQGVCFRMETQRAAENIGVSGWVRNKRDGCVEAVFEGEETLVNEAVSWCRKGAPLSRVDDVSVNWLPYTGEFKGFKILF